MPVTAFAVMLATHALTNSDIAVLPLADSTHLSQSLVHVGAFILIGKMVTSR